MEIAKRSFSSSDILSFYLLGTWMRDLDLGVGLGFVVLYLALWL